jgi:hypothetical protein
MNPKRMGSVGTYKPKLLVHSSIFTDNGVKNANPKNAHLVS